MQVESISYLNNVSFYPELLKTDASKGKSAFESVFQAAIKVLEETNAYQLQAEQAQVDLAAGRTDNIIAVTLAQDRAYDALNFTVQVTNKIIEAYREIMRIQL